MYISSRVQYGNGKDRIYEKNTHANDILIPELARLIAEGKEVRFTPSGVSMRPFIEGDKDSVILSSVSVPKRGDILLAKTTTLCDHTT